MHDEKPVLLLDVMDTLVKDPFFDKIPEFFGLSLEELLAQKHPTAWVEFERGELTPRDYYERLFADGRPFCHDELEQLLRSSYTWIEGMQSLLQELESKNVEMHALSNYPIWYRMIDEALGLGRYVQWTFVSCETKRRKPDPAAFLSAAEALRRAPAGCLFIDDRESNCAAARGVGMPALHFRDAATLRSELISLGIL